MTLTGRANVKSMNRVMAQPGRVVTAKAYAHGDRADHYGSAVGIGQTPVNAHILTTW
jgi:hypothetical protein